MGPWQLGVDQVRPQAADVVQQAPPGTGIEQAAERQRVDRDAAGGKAIRQRVAGALGQDRDPHLEARRAQSRRVARQDLLGAALHQAIDQ